MAKGGQQQVAVRLFYSYNRKDEDLRDQLDEQLAVLKRSGLIAPWHDREIAAGTEWKDQIDDNLKSADIILALVSPSFLASDYCWDKETEKALERHARGEARVIPVILRPCHWQKTPLGTLQALPRDAKPVTTWPDRDEAFVDIAKGIDSAIEALRAGAPHPTPSEPAPPPASASPTDDAGPGVVSALADLTVFKDVDLPWTPEMVVVPAGSFLMGSPPGERDRLDAEGPQHPVEIGDRLALGRYPVTFAEYDHYCEVSGAEKSWDKDWGRGRRPVVNVSWEDSQAYIAWLSNETGQSYRLPSEAEWEYACRAGTTTRYAFGDALTENQANFGGHLGKTSEVGSYDSNHWGLYDMHGNVWEWVEDVWHGDYEGAPADGTAWTKGGDQGVRVLRGGSWSINTRNVRSAFRYWYAPVFRLGNFGFRVARTLFGPGS